MIQNRLEKQVKELENFYENHPNDIQILTISDYKNLLKGLLSLMSKSFETIDYTGIYAYFGIVGQIDKYQLMDAIELKKENCKEPVSIDYTDVSKILNIYRLCLQPENNLIFNSNEWLILMGDIRVLEMERLGSNVKK